MSADQLNDRLVTLAVQNALLAIIMRYSRVSTPPSQAYSAAAAVLMNEVLKGSISLAIAFARVDVAPNSGSFLNPRHILSRFRRLGKEVFSSDCWKLSIPAILYGKQSRSVTNHGRVSYLLLQWCKTICNTLPLPTLKQPHSKSLIK
jgi:hypothetical protein